LIVLEGQTVIGSISAAQIAGGLSHDPGATVGMHMSPAPSALQLSDSLERAAEVLSDDRIVFVTVIDGAGHFAGVVTRREVLEAYRSVNAV
jgi:CBS domain-containing protein